MNTSLNQFAVVVAETNDFSSYAPILTTLVICLVATVIIEVLGALICKVRGKNLVIVLLAQIATNPLAVLITRLAALRIDNSEMTLLILALTELWVVFAEGLMYKAFFNNYKTFFSPFALSFFLNLLSFTIGIGIIVF